MASKIETSHSGMFLDTRLRTLLDDLNKELIDSDLSTKEEVFTTLNKVINDYAKTLNKSLFTYKPVASGVEPSASKFNTDNLIIYNDLKILYQSLSNTRNLLASNYNTLSGMLLKLKTDVAEASSKLIDYKIQNSNRITPTFLDSFYNLSKIETDDSKYTKTKAFIDTFNSNVVLPLDGEAKAAKIKRANIGMDSNGLSGNNQEVGAISRENLKLALDNSVDTWFEFEQVGATELELPTTLNLKFEFEEEIFFNLLDINVAQMPNGSYPAIIEVMGSTDGAVFFDLRPLYLGRTDWDSLGNEIIPLGENLENPNSGNLLYFSPRKIKFLNIKFMEDSSYFIRTSSGVKYRRAIGIKEIKPKSQKFKNEGQLITTNFLSNSEISKIALFTDEYSPANFLSTFSYFVSVDDGQTWEAISPSQKVKEDIPEVLNYNIDFLEDSKKTDFPVSSIKLKAEYLLEEGTETTSVNASYKTKNHTEFLTLSPGTKSISLEKVPFGDVNIYKTNYGSVGKDSYYKIQNITIRELRDRSILQLPLNVFPASSIQIDQEHLYIDNYLWTRVSNIDSSHLDTDHIYEFDYLNNIITFNKEISQVRHGKRPIGDIFFKLKRENLQLNPAQEGTEFITNFQHDAIKENISVYSVSDEVSEVLCRLRNMASVHRLTVNEIEGVQVATDPTNFLQTEKSFINGVIELTSAGDYSIDKKHGTIYTFNPLGPSTEVIIKILYRKKENIDFKVENGKVITTEELKKDNRVFSIDIPLALYAVDLGYRNIEKNSIVFTQFPSLLSEEVPFQAIEEEFNKTDGKKRYAIDYKNGILYSQNKIDGVLRGTLINSNYFGEYNISYKIPETSYALVRNERRVDLTDKEVSDYYNSSSNEILSPSLVKVEYLYTEDVKESLSELFPYTTPFIKEYRIITTPKES